MTVDDLRKAAFTAGAIVLLIVVIGVAVWRAGIAGEVRHVDAPTVQPTPDIDANFENGDVPEIPGNSGHNLLAGYNGRERAAALVAVVKSNEGITRCSPTRTLYQGYYKKEAFWSVECHTGATFKVAIDTDGSGTTMSCNDELALKLKSDCWTKWKRASLPWSRTPVPERDAL